MAQSLLLKNRRHIVIRRNFLKSSAVAVATAALYSPLSAAGFGDSANQKKIAIVSESAGETGYIHALAKNNKMDDVIILGSDRLENLHTLSDVLEKNKGALICGLLENSDYALLNHAALSNGAKFVSETAHTPSNAGISHTENSFASMSLKKAFDQFSSLNTDQYGIALSSYHTTGAHNTVATSKQVDFVSDHTSKNAFVSFVLKA